jgi:hypothetical protein
MKTERRDAEFRGRSPLTDLKAAPFSIYGVSPEIERDAREDSLPNREGRALRKVQEQGSAGVQRQSLAGMQGQRPCPGAGRIPLRSRVKLWSGPG